MLPYTSVQVSCILALNPGLFYGFIPIQNDSSNANAYLAIFRKLILEDGVLESLCQQFTHHVLSAACSGNVEHFVFANRSVGRIPAHTKGTDAGVKHLQALYSSQWPCRRSSHMSTIALMQRCQMSHQLLNTVNVFLTHLSFRFLIGRCPPLLHRQVPR